MDAAAVKALASIPGRNDLIAMLLGVMQAPASSMARVLAAVAEKKAKEAA
jgi:large subunit ribosomal protein L10